MGATYQRSCEQQTKPHGSPPFYRETGYAGKVHEISRFFRVPLSEIGFVRAIVEAHEGLAQVVSNDADRGEIEIVIPESMAQEAETMIARLCGQGCVEIPRPADWR